MTDIKIKPRAEIKPDIVLVQASPVTWDGAPDFCMNPVYGYKSAVHATLAKVLDQWSDAEVCVIAPTFAREYGFGGLADDYPQIRLYYGSDENPLLRMVEACRHLDGKSLCLRLDGISYCWRPDLVNRLLALAKSEELDCAKAPDDLPCVLTGDVYRVAALRRALEILEGENSVVPQFPEASAYHVHVKHFLFREGGFRCACLEDLPHISDEYLSEAREASRSVYNTLRIETDKSKAITVGGQLLFHYRKALEFLPERGYVLEIACGSSAGVEILASHCGKVLAADLDADLIERNSKLNTLANVRYMVADVTALPFGDAEFDGITSFETIEHVDVVKYLGELSRVLKDNGVCVISTPQNSLGHIPINIHHHTEFSVRGLLDAVRPWFAVEKILGIKQGCIIHEDNPRGQNTMLVMRKQRQV